MKTDVTAGDQALQPLCERLEAVLSAHDDGSDGSHDVHHSRRVLRMALRIAQAEGGADAVTLACAAYLHDLVNLPKNHPDRSRASAMSADAARPILLPKNLVPNRPAIADPARGASGTASRRLGLICPAMINLIQFSDSRSGPLPPLIPLRNG